MRSQFPGELWPNRNKACLEEFSVANRDDLFGQIDVLQGQTKSLANAHSAPVEQQQERTVNRRYLTAVPYAQHRRRFQQSVEFFCGIDVGSLVWRQLRHSR